MDTTKIKSSIRTCLFLCSVLAFFAQACGDDSAGFSGTDTQTDPCADLTGDATMDGCPSQADATGDATSDTSYSITVSRVDPLSSTFLDFEVQTDSTEDVEVLLFLIRDGATVPSHQASFQKTTTVNWYDSNSEVLYTYFKTKVIDTEASYVWFAHDNDGARPLDASTSYRLYYYDLADPNGTNTPVLAGTYATEVRRASIEPIREAPQNQAGSRIIMPYGSWVHTNLLITEKISVQINSQTINDINAADNGAAILNVGGFQGYNNMIYDLSTDNQIQFSSKIANSSFANQNRVIYYFLADTTSDNDNEATLTIDFY